MLQDKPKHQIVEHTRAVNADRMTRVRDDRQFSANDFSAMISEYFLDFKMSSSPTMTRVGAMILDRSAVISSL